MTLVLSLCVQYIIMIMMMIIMVLVIMMMMIIIIIINYCGWIWTAIDFIIKA